MYWYSQERRREVDPEFARRYLESRTAPVSCLIPNCPCRAIRSHMITRGTALGTIAENRRIAVLECHRLQCGEPFDFRERNPYSISTFTGFCCNHDQCLFQRIDRGDFSTFPALVQQSYRTVCHAFFHQRLSLELNEGLRDGMLRRRGGDPELRALARWRCEEGRGLLAFLEQVKSRLERLLFQFNARFPRVKQNVCYSLPGLPVRLLYFRAPFRIPVATGWSCFVQSGKAFRRLPSLFFSASVIPGRLWTDLIFLYDPRTFFYPYWQRMSRRPIKILNVIEALLLNSDFWAVSPGVLAAMPEERRKLLAEDLYCNVLRGYLAPYDLSIFDELRLDILRDCTPDIRDRELRKIELLPQRPPFRKRAQTVMDRLF